ncbi:MAG: hypothetical protein COC06_09890 [Bacteroidales bacterium]|nr:MAG: hypothetical protein COC06_09890 [Bacteroidales bacterium]
MKRLLVIVFFAVILGLSVNSTFDNMLNIDLASLENIALADDELPDYPGETWYRFGEYSKVTYTETIGFVKNGVTVTSVKTYTVYDCVGYGGDC